MKRMKFAGAARALAVLCLGASMHVAAFAGVPSTEFLAGTCAHLETGKTDAKAFAAQSRQLGTNSFRTDISWWHLEAAKGQLAFPASLANLDQAINDAAAAGGHPLLILDYGNALYDNGSFPLSDEAQAAFVRYVQFVVTRYKGKVRHYEVWNEWNIGLATGHKVPYTYPGSARDYARLLKKVYRAIKAIDPDAVVIAGAVANRDVAWIREMVASADGQYDGVSVHPYNYSAGGAARTPEEAVQWLGSLHVILPPAANGQAPAIYVTEMGWPTHAGAHGTNRDMAADYLARFFLLAREKAFIKGVWWYDFQDDGDNRNEPEHNFGLVTRQLEPKPAFGTLRDVAKLVEGAKSAQRINVGEGLRATRIARADGGASIAVWSLGDARTVEIASSGAPVTVSVIETGSNGGARHVQIGKDLKPATIVVTGRPFIVSGNLDNVVIKPESTFLSNVKNLLSR